ncbi:rRNA pseudouridine synthase [Neisseria perflava]|uniref:pseudouridine synthase n=1 Tax=Neisseria perflava TaxID=33053 RepID=UPI00201ACF83|nr:pseudouridine synthase [Neisseria perflava]MCL5078205.1 rRNA pseudouridine synthase [Neisseria perflava]
MSKQPSSKRQWRDGVSSTAKKPSKPAKSFANKKRPDDERKTSGKPYGQKVSDGPKAQNTAPKQRAAKAKKLVVRNPNQKIMEHARDLKERRSDLSRFEPERLQKVLAASGVGSRREMEEWISNGWVTVNGRVAQLGEKVTPDDHVTVKGSIIKLKWADRLPQAASSRWVAIGRLDINTSGLLILTTSGELVQRFAHPSFEVEREYAVRVLGELTTEQMCVLTEEGVMLEDGLAKVERIYEQGGEGANKWYNVVIKEGRNREVRRIFESQGLTVSRLVRVGFGPIGLPNRLKRGQFYELNPAEVANIIKWADMLLPGERRRKKS